MLDSPCDSFSWMPRIKFEALNATYVGVDIVPSNIETAKAARPTKQPSGWDLIFSREFLQHLPHEAIKRLLRNKTGPKYLLLTHEPSNAVNKDIDFGGYEPINMRAPPFNLGPPLDEFPDAGHERLLLYKLPLVGFQD